MDVRRDVAQRLALLSIGVLGCGTHTSLADTGAGDEERPVAVAGAGGMNASSPSDTGAGMDERPVAVAGASGMNASSPSASNGRAGTSSAAGSSSNAGAAPPSAGSGSSGQSAAMGGSAVDPASFSFFVTSLEAMQELSGSQDGFGGDLRYGESTGLAGADKICTEVAERSLAGAGSKVWRAFLSAKAGGPNGEVVHARDRIGNGPWYDGAGRLVAMNLDALLTTRPAADAAIVNDLPNEHGIPNHGPPDIDNHDVVTASDAMGRYSNGITCNDWTSTETVMPPADMRRNGFNHNGPTIGHSWPAQSGQSWIYAHAAPGCSPSVGLTQTGAGSGVGIGNGGGYGGIYCFAMTP
jgi:hypothetical protein